MNTEELKEEIQIRLLEWRLNQLKMKRWLRKWQRMKKLFEGVLE